MKLVVAVKLVYRIITAEVAEATIGWTPICSSTGARGDGGQREAGRPPVKADRPAGRQDISKITLLWSEAGREAAARPHSIKHGHHKPRRAGRRGVFVSALTARVRTALTGRRIPERWAKNIYPTSTIYICCMGTDTHRQKASRDKKTLESLTKCGAIAHRDWQENRTPFSSTETRNIEWWFSEHCSGVWSKLPALRQPENSPHPATRARPNILPPP